MSDLDPVGRGLLDAARAARPSAAARARIDAGLTARLGASAAAPPDPPTSPPATSGGAASLAAGPLAKLALMAALLGGGAGAAALLRPASPASTQSAAMPASSAVAPAPRDAPGTPATAPELPPSASAAASALPAPAPRRPARRRDAPAPASSIDPPAPPGTLGEELAILRSAQRSLKQGDGAASLAQLDALAAQYPGGVLREERLAARVLALCAAGRVEEAREAGRRFVAEVPASVQAPRVRASCAFAPGDEKR